MLGIVGTKVQFVAVDLGSAVGNDRLMILRRFEMAEYEKVVATGKFTMLNKQRPEQPKKAAKNLAKSKLHGASAKKRRKTCA
jgi:hypothetical protein